MGHLVIKKYIQSYVFISVYLLYLPQYPRTDKSPKSAVALVKKKNGRKRRNQKKQLQLLVQVLKRKESHL